MKFFISVDMEGISGIVDVTMVSRKLADYTSAKDPRHRTPSKPSSKPT